MLRLLLYDYQRAVVTIRYIVLSKASRMATLRLFHDYFIGEITTIGYDYSRNCHDYFSRSAATIADFYWLSGESPKKSCGESRQWFRAARRALATGLPPPGGGCQADPVRPDR